MQFWKLEKANYICEGNLRETINTRNYIQNIPRAQNSVFINWDVGFWILSNSLYEQITNWLLDSFKKTVLSLFFDRKKQLQSKILVLRDM